MMGSDSGVTLSLGQRVTVRLVEATPVTGGLMLELLAVDGVQMAGGARPARGKPVHRRSGASHARAAAKERKVKRTRR